MLLKLDFDQAQTADRLSDSILKWIARSYESMEEWKTKAKNVFFFSNGESELSRNRVATMIRSHVIEAPQEPEEVRRWKVGLEEIETVKVSPPKVSASNSIYVDWLYVADYLLLACASQMEELDAENERRDAEFRNLKNSYTARSMVYEARKIMQQNHTLSDQEVLATIKKTFPDVVMANIKEARKQEKGDVRHIHPKEPIPPKPMPRYTSVYF